jgi:hypothetical protein
MSRVERYLYIINDCRQNEENLSAASQEIISAFKCLEAFKWTKDNDFLETLRTLVDSKILSVEYFPNNKLSNENLFYLNQLQKLILNNDNEIYLNIDVDLFAQLHNLLELDFGSYVIQLEPSMFKNMSKLKMLTLTLCSMDNIEELSNLKALKKLNIDTRLCQSVNASLFSSLANLEEIVWTLIVMPSNWNDGLSKMNSLKRFCIKEFTNRYYGKNSTL